MRSMRAGEPTSGTLNSPLVIYSHGNIYEMELRGQQENQRLFPLLSGVLIRGKHWFSLHCIFTFFSHFRPRSPLKYHPSQRVGICPRGRLPPLSNPGWEISMKKLIAALGFALLLAACSPMLFLHGCNKGGNDSTRLEGGGSSFVFPMMSKWAKEYEQAKKVQINYQSIGSGGG